MIDAEMFDRLLTPVDCGISIYMPIDPDQRDKRAPQARLRALVDKAVDLLGRYRNNPAEHAALHEALKRSNDTIDFARHRDPALAIFAAQREGEAWLTWTVSLPRSLPETVTVGNDFHIKPLLPLIAANQRFSILALSKANVRLLAATPFTWTELPLNTLPVEAQAELDALPAAEGAPGEDARHDAARKLLVADPRYIATAVKAAVKDDPAPIVLVADPHVAGHFRQQVEINQLYEQWLDLNPFALSDAELHAKVLDVIGPALDVDLNAVLEQVSARLGTGKPNVAIKLEEILVAAREGRVDAVVVADDEPVWGSVRQDGSVIAHGTPNPSDTDLLNSAAVMTLRHGGRAFAAPRERLPRQVPAVATLRF